MKLLFITQNARTIQDDEGNLYLNSHMNRNTIKRYAELSSELIMIIRDSGIRCSKVEACKKYDKFPLDLAKPIVGPNPYLSLRNYLNLDQRIRFTNILREKIGLADKVIISSSTGYYAQKAIPLCKEKGVDYLLFVGGFAFETNWNHSLKGKIVAPFNELLCKKNLLEAPFALYVTERELQNRYPCKGRTIGCSDVEIKQISEEILERRIKRIQSSHVKKRILGTAASLEDRQKGQKYVIYALAELKKQGITDLEYQLIGGGNSRYLYSCAEKCGVVDQVKFLGNRPHEEVYNWLDNIDVYIQPSFSEGLCRAVVEAMSRACPIICSNVGGNIELCPNEFSFRAGNIRNISTAIIKSINKTNMEKEAVRSYETAKKYVKENLDKKRNDFFKEFINNRAES